MKAATVEQVLVGTSLILSNTTCANKENPLIQCHPAFLNEVSCLISCSSLSLQTFLLDGNSLEELPNELGSLQRLSYVGLSFNQFNHVPQVLEQLASMEKLCMAGNNLETLTLQNFRLLRVKHIDLRYDSD